jgi:hypothetical protein|tara:strand:+ start:442 stop:756 length:315 start_codon:yes stop_codon:yes gene_type:complete
MDKFVDKYLEDVEWNQNFSQGWNVSGVLKNRLNENLKYDLRPVKNDMKEMSYNSKADKIVFDIDEKYYIVDFKELSDFVKENKIKKIHLKKVIKDLDWNIILNK